MSKPSSKHPILSLSMASALVLSACGGADSGSADALAANSRATASAAAQHETQREAQRAVAGSQIAVMARGTLAGNWGPVMELRANGQLLGRVEVRSATYQAYYFTSPTLLANGSSIEVSFVNDAVVAGVDRNLYVQSINIDGKKVASSAPEVRYVRGWDEIAGQEAMLWNGSLRLTYSGNQALTVRARGSLAAGVAPLMDVQLNGESIAKVAVFNTQYDDYTFNLPSTLPPNSKLDIVFSNDVAIGNEDRNLYIESIKFNGTEYKSSATGVSYDRGALDGVDVIPGQEAMLWNGALRFSLAPPPPPPPPTSVTVRPGDTPPSGYTLCATENQNCAFTGAANVVYGAASTWTQPRSFTGGAACNNGTFGDPLPGVSKACYVLAGVVPPKPVDPPPPTGTVIGIPLTSGFHPGLSGPAVYATSEVVPRSGDGTGDFRTRCAPAKMAYVDPLVFPGQAGASHLHTFFGNTGINESSTTASLRAGGNSTCRGGTVNRSAYWVPSMVDTRTNLAVMPAESDFYYKTGYLGVRPQDVKPFPPDFRMIAGNAMNSVPATSYASGFNFVCHNAGTQRGSTIPNCAVGDQVEMTINFPQCWDGVNSDSPDHKSHVAYATGAGCPTSHPVALTEISFHVLYDITSANQSTFWRLSSDRVGVTPGYSAHGDWMNGWDEAIMKTWVERCLNPGNDCHSHLLGDGRAIGGL